MTSLAQNVSKDTHWPSSCRGGFALIATISVMVLLVMVALAMLSLSTIELRNASGNNHKAIAQANARLAMMQALSELQKHAGPDRRVTARAAILENGSNSLPNRNWLGVWKTSHTSGGESWPVIGKAPSSGSNGSPYSRPGAYEDLRHTAGDLQNGAWKEKLRLSWLVSKRSATSGATSTLNPSDDHVVEILGRGTLGTGLSAGEYNKNRVLVEKVDVDDQGAYAWYIADNNQKASIDPLREVDLAEAAFEASPRANPALIQTNGGTPFSPFTQKAMDQPGKLASYLTAALTQADPKTMGQLLGENVHHLTTYSPGLFTNTMAGGLRHDLTPLLLANKGDKVVDFTYSQGSLNRAFSSSYPIIPGPEHGVLGPSFGALRNWAQHTYTNLKDAETSFASSATRMRPTAFWPHNISDGACADASQWAESAPKIHPVMTDCRWHYYFSHHNKRIRTHIIPRVCLWNPYNRELKIPVLSVLMPNPFYQLSHGILFFPEESHVNELKDKYKSNSSHPFTKWIKKRGYIDENGNNTEVYKMRLNPFPNQRFLAFSLEPTTLAPGECHVFSPKVTNPTLVSRDGVKVQLYQPVSVGANILSSRSLQGRNHYIYDHDSSKSYQVQAPGWRSLGTSDLSEIDFSRIFDYQPSIDMQKSRGNVESFPFVLKVGTASSLSSLHSSSNHPTLQLINNAAGGVHATNTFAIQGENWGPASQGDNSFGNLQTFDEASLKDAPDTHQFGAKLLWLNERYTEANRPPLRHGTRTTTRWVPDHMAFNVCPIANWNVRAQLHTRSPVSQCGRRYYLNSLGAWLLQFVPHSPQDVSDQPSEGTSGALTKNPFGSTVHFPYTQDVVLFDLPSEDYGVLSLARLRHAMLSPYSWNPSYIVGHSLRDMHAPSNFSAHDMAVSAYAKTFPPTRWDFMLGGYKASSVSHGPETALVDSQGLLQIGNQGVTRSVDGTTLSSESEVLAYDIAYEVNHNLWDRFFVSSMPLANGTQSFNWDASNNKPLWNTRYQFNYDSGIGKPEAESLVSGTGGLNTAFWRNAELLKNRAAFNVNSTSVEAWTAFLSGTLGIKRPLKSGELDGDAVSFARHQRPATAAETKNTDLDRAGAWIGARKLSDDEVRALAENIVIEVQKRGPFVSLADFVNRRLTDTDDETSHMGTLDAAIKASGLNSRFERNTDYVTGSVIRGSDPRSEDNNHPTFKNSYRYRSSGGQYTTVQPKSQAWGLPGFLTQGDLLEPLAPSIAVRGDTFTIRAYGESSVNGEVKARAWLEVTVERTPHYVDSKAAGATGPDGNAPADIPLIMQHATGQYVDGNLSDANKRFGRQFVIKSLRWLSSEEI